VLPGGEEGKGGGGGPPMREFGRRVGRGELRASGGDEWLWTLGQTKAGGIKRVSRESLEPNKGPCHRRVNVFVFLSTSERRGLWRNTGLWEGGGHEGRVGHRQAGIKSPWKKLPL